MGTAITAKEFKILISGNKTVSELFERQMKLGSNYPSVNLESIGDDILVISGFIMETDLIFEAGEIYEKEIFIDGGEFRNIIFKGGHFKKIVFRRGEFNGYVSIRGGTIENLVLLGGKFKHWLGTLNGIHNFQTDVKMLADEPLKIHRMEIEGGSYENNIWISGGEIESLEIKCVTPVKIHCKPSDDKIFNIEQNKYTNRYQSEPKIKNLVISRYSNKDTFFHFSDLKLETIKFENFTNLGNITISKIVLTKFICFENSDIGKTTFIDCNFSKQKMYFDSSKITEIALAGSILPSPKEIISYTGVKSQSQLALSQIKKVYQNMGDSVTAGRYQSEELNTYMTTLKFGWEKINLWLNFNTNRHGQNWAVALKILLSGSILLYTAYCFALGFNIDISQNGLNVFIRNATYYLEFLNPIRKSDFLPKVLSTIKDETSLPPMVVVIDGISKVFNTYLIYQFIAAFRKHGKKAD